MTKFCCFFDFVRLDACLKTGISPDGRVGADLLGYRLFRLYLSTGKPSKYDKNLIWLLKFGHNLCYNDLRGDIGARPTGFVFRRQK